MQCPTRQRRESGRSASALGYHAARGNQDKFASCVLLWCPRAAWACSARRASVVSRDAARLHWVPTRRVGTRIILVLMRVLLSCPRAAWACSTRRASVVNRDAARLHWVATRRVGTRISSCPAFFSRSHALRGNAVGNALALCFGTLARLH